MISINNFRIITPEVSGRNPLSGNWNTLISSGINPKIIHEEHLHFCYNYQKIILFLLNTVVDASHSLKMYTMKRTTL